ncbi:DUF2845 domain-containing protein [Methylococcus sp. EFPC2]|uniref:DUF2845 domain-containing protein n=1 Tax=Methylococcus sp. EFPC2 TaxID=2812648 RepID=UPI0019678920|nr:DUF2845 domain-containing protein [Methylococcus sp. EFPC2]QSA98205.1 DUF2845 domain-containing protein [Methylococcus sp. EFPC2]
MKTHYGILLMALCMLTQEAWALRCDRELVLAGDAKIQVLRKCGEPALTEHRVEYRSYRQRGSGLQQPGLDFEYQVPVNIDEWTYNFGPHRFMQRLIFENGRLVKIEDLDYGF